MIEAQSMRVPCFISHRIPSEADLGLCTKISLDTSPKEWAQIIYNQLSDNNRLFLDKEKLANYNISNVIKEYEKIYRASH